MLMMHQVVPHVHHAHEQESSPQTIADHHHHGNDHQHSHQSKAEEKEDDEKDEANDFWQFLLGNHTHNYHSDFNQRSLKKNLRKLGVEKDLQVHLSVEIWVPHYESPPPLLRKHPPNPNYRVFISTQALRGPPALG